MYGSNDGGTTVHMDDAKFNELMKVAGIHVISYKPGRRREFKEQPTRTNKKEGC